MAYQQFVMERGGIKTIISIPWTVDQLQYGQNKSEKVKDEADSFSKVPLLFRAVNLRCNTLTSVPYKITKINGKDEIEYPYEEMLPFQDLIWKTEASLLLKGASYCVRLADEGGTQVGLQWLNPFTVVVKKVNRKDPTSTEIGFQQYLNGKTYPLTKEGYWSADEMFYLRQFSVSDDIGPGTAPAAVGMTSSRLQHYLTFFASQFFESGAMPVTMLGLPGDPQPAEKERVESFFKKAMQGMRNAFRVLAVSGEVKPQILTPDFKDLAIPALKEHAIDDISWAFDIPKTVLISNAANYATADSDMQHFLKHTIIPRTKFFEHQFNTKLLNDFDMKLTFFPQQMTELQEDEKERSGAFRNYVLSGMKPQLAAAVLGIDIPEDYKAEWEAGPTEPLLTGRQSVLAQGVTEAPPGPVVEESGGKDVGEKSAMRDDLDRWKRKALKRLDAKKSAQVEFESSFIPSEIKAGVFALLEKADNADVVRGIFAEVVNHYCAPAATLKTSVELNREILQSIESLDSRVKEIKIDVAGMTTSVGDSFGAMQSEMNRIIETAKTGDDQWRAEFKSFREQYETKSAQERKQYDESMSAALFSISSELTETVKTNADRILENRIAEQDGTKTAEAIKNVSDKLYDKLEAIHADVNRKRIRM